MKKIWIVITIIAVVALAIVLTVTQTKKKPEEIKIGAILPLTGDAAPYGERAKRGVEFALEEINKKGIKGNRIKIIYEDSQGNPQKAVSAFLKLINLDKVKFILGPLSTTEVLSIAPMAEKEKILILTPTASAPQITKAGDYIFRNCVSDLFEGIVAAEFIFKKLNERRAAIIYINNDFGIGLKESFKKRFISLGGEVIEESFERKETDFRALLSRIKSKDPKVIFLIGQTEMGQILRQAKELGIKSQFVSFSAFEDPKILQVAGGAAEGVFYTYQGFDTKSEVDVVREFTLKYKEKYNENPDIWAALSYDAMKIYAEAFKRDGFNVEDTKKALYSIKGFIGVVGETSFDENGDVTKPIGIKKVENGNFIWIDKKYELEGEK